MNLQPYLFFDGKCEEALDFYKQTVGAEAKMLMRFKESPDCPPSGKFPAESRRQDPPGKASR